eukprot:TRINITY_DN7348_c1_g1_i1.p1 TRINITY_DN7348_c1_g1~~TRINITY_DN7348_c1_g1_i1.p1  ORF type:complete len:308 (+),score=113.33 TRINITY_DN7348_c1_g1_i1:56-979(+)
MPTSEHAPSEVPVIRVPRVKVVFSVEDVQVKYVLDVQCAGRAWQVEKTFTEIREFGNSLVKGPPLPPFRFAYWKTNAKFSKIEERRVAVAKYFEAVSARGLYVIHKNTFQRFLQVTRHMVSLEYRPPPPASLNTEWWCSMEDVMKNLRRCGDAAAVPPALPGTILVGTASSLVQPEGGRGVRVILPMSKGQPRGDAKLKVFENSVFYAWVAGFDDRVPTAEETRRFMLTVRTIVKQGRMLIPRSSTQLSAFAGYSDDGEGEQVLSARSGFTSSFASAHTVVSLVPDSPVAAVRIVVTPPPQPVAAHC